MPETSKQRVNRFALEGLEPRLLLSGDGLDGSITIDPFLAQNPSEAIEADLNSLPGNVQAGAELYDPTAVIDDIFDGVASEALGEDGTADGKSATTYARTIGADEILGGNTRLSGDVLIEGILSPGNSPGIAHFDGDTTLDGTTLIELGGTAPGTEHDQVVMDSGSLTLGGALQITLLDGFVPSVGQSFDIFTLSSSGAQGSFASLDGLSFTSGAEQLFLIPILTPSKLTLVASARPSGSMVYETDSDSEGEALANFFTTDSSSATTVTFAGELDIPGVASVGGSFGLQFGGGSADPILIASNGVHASVAAGSFSASLTGGSLGAIIQPDGTMALQATGGFSLAGGGFANVQADSATLLFNNTVSAVNLNLTVGLATAAINVPKDAVGLAVTGLNAEFNGMAQVQGDFGFIQAGLDVLAVANNVAASVTGGGTTLSIEGGSLGFTYDGQTNKMALEAGAVGLAVTGNSFANISTQSVKVQFNNTGVSQTGKTIGVGGATYTFSNTMTATLHAGLNVKGFKAEVGGALTVEGDFSFVQDGQTIEVVAGNVSTSIATSSGNFAVGVQAASLALRIDASGIALAAKGTPSLNLGADLLNVSAETVKVSFNSSSSSYSAVLVGGGVSETLVVAPGSLFVFVAGFKVEVKTFVDITGDFGFARNGNGLDAVAVNGSAILSAGKASAGVKNATLALRLNSDGTMALRGNGHVFVNLGSKFGEVGAETVEVAFNSSSQDYSNTVLTVGGNSADLKVAAAVEGVPVATLEVTGLYFNMGSAFALLGKFAAQKVPAPAIGTSGLEFAGSVTSLDLKVGSKRLVKLGGTAAFRANNDGLAADLFLDLMEGPSLSGVALGGTFHVRVNTTGVDVAAIKTRTVNLAAETPLELHVAGSMDIRGQALEGTFDFMVGTTEAAVTATVTKLELFAGATMLFSVHGSGKMLVNEAGVAAELDLSGTGPTIPNFAIAGSLSLAVNTTTQRITSILNESVDLPAGPYVWVRVDGSLTIKGQVFEGSFGFSRSNDEVAIAAEVTRFELKAGAKRLVSLSGLGAMVVRETGVAAQMTLNLLEGPEIADLAVSGTFTVAVNTTGTTITEILGEEVELPAVSATDTYVYVHVGGALAIKGQNMAGHFTFMRNSNEVAVQATVSALELKAGAKRVISLSGEGAMVIRESGVAAQFTLNLLAGPEIADLAISGTFTLGINTTGTSITNILGQAVQLPTVSSTDKYVYVKVGGSLGVKGQAFEGTFTFSRSNDEVAIAAVVSKLELKAGAKRVVSLSGSGAMVIRPTGVGAQFNLNLLAGPEIADLALSGSFTLAVNTTGTTITNILGVNVTLPAVSATDIYVRVQVAGSLAVKGQVFEGSFAFSRSNNEVAVLAKVDRFELKAGTKRLFSLQGLGALVVRENGVATQMSLNLLNGPDIADFAISGSFEVAVNTTGDDITKVLGEDVDLPGSGEGAYVRVYVSGDITVAGQHIAGSFGFEKNGSDVGVSLTISSFEVTTGGKVLVSLQGLAAMLFTQDGFAGQFSLAVLDFPAINQIKLSGGVTVYINTTGKSVSEIANADVDLEVANLGDKIIKVKVDSFKVAFGQYLTLAANDVLFDLLATGSQPIVIFGGNPNVAGSGALEVQFGGSSVFAGWGGRAGNFAIGADLSFQLRDQFYVSISVGNSTFGLPSWLPIVINKVGLKFGEGAVDASGRLVQPGNFNIMFSGGVDGTKAWVEAQVRDLEVSLQKLVSGDFPIVNIGGLSLGVRNLKIGPATVTGLVTFGILKIDGDLNTPGIQEKSAFYGRLAGEFFYSGIGGGIDIGISSVGPVVATFSLGGLTIPKLGFVFGFKNVGINFGGGPWSSVTSPEQILTNDELRNPVSIDTEQFVRRVEKAVAANQLTWDTGFTIGGTVTVTNIYVQGIIQGNATLAVNVGYNAPGAGLKILAIGDISVYGIPIAGAGMLFDFSNPLRPMLNMTMALPSPSNPFGFLFPATGTASLTLDTKGVMEMPIVGLSVFAQRIAEHLVLDQAGLFSQVMNSIASRLESNRTGELSTLLLDLDLNGLVDGAESTQVITKEFILKRLGGINDTVPSLMVSTFVALDPVNGVDPITLGRGLRAVDLFVPELFDVIVKLTPLDYQTALMAFADAVQDAAIQGLAAGWERFDPSLTITGRLQPTFFGIPLGDPTASGTMVFKKDVVTVKFSGHILQLLLSQFSGPLMPVIVSLPPGLMALADTTEFEATNTMPGSLVTSLITDLSTNGPDAVSLSKVVLDYMNPFTGWEIFFASTLTSFGFKLGSVSGIMFGAQVDEHGVEHPSASFSSRVVNLDPDGDGRPNAQLIQDTNAKLNSIPVATKAQYDKMRQYGGMVMTGQLFMPDLIIDPVATVQAINWTPPTIDFNIGDPLAILDQLTAVQEYVEGIYEGLTKQSEWAKIQLYIASPARLFEVDNYLTPTPGRLEKVTPVDFASLSQDLQAQLLEILNAGFVEGYAKLRMFGTDFGTAHIEGTISGFSAEMEVPWLAGLQIKAETGYQRQNVSKLIRELASSPLANAAGVSDALLNLLSDSRVALDFDLPVASFEGSLSTARVADWLVEQFGLPTAVFAPVSSGQEGFTSFLGIYTPGFANEGTTGVKRTGGLVLDTRLNITGIVDEANFSFEIQPFSFFENTDLATFLIPNFAAHASVPNLTIPGLSGRPDLVSLTGFNLDLVKDPTGIHFGINGSLTLLGNPAFSVSGFLEFNSEGLYGDIVVKLGGGSDLSFQSNGLQFGGDGHLRINTTNAEKMGIAAHTALVYLAGGMQLKINDVELMLLNGFFKLSVGNGALRVAADVTVRVATVGGLTASGELNLDTSGIYGVLNVSVRNVGGPGFVFDGAIKAEINTTFGAKLGIKPLSAKVLIAGSLQLALGGIGSYGLSGGFAISASLSGLEVSLNAQLNAGMFGSFNVIGGLGMSDAGIWGALQLGYQTRTGPGYNLSANFQLEINTTSSIKEVVGFVVSPLYGDIKAGQVISIGAHSLRILGGGQLQLGGNSFAIQGAFGISGTGGQLSMFINGTVNVFGLMLEVFAQATIYGNDGVGLGGLFLSAQLGFAGTPQFGVGGLTFSGTVYLLINSSPVTRNGVGGNTYVVNVAGATVSFLGLRASGSFSIGVSSGVFSVSVPSWSPLRANFGVFGDLSFHGWFNSHGQFSFTASVSYSQGSTVAIPNLLDGFKKTAYFGASVSLSGSITVSHNGFSASLSASASAGYSIRYWWYHWGDARWYDAWAEASIGASASASISFNNGVLKASMSASLTGSGLPWPVNEFVKVLPKFNFDVTLGTQQPTALTAVPASFSVPAFGEINKPITVTGSSVVPASGSNMYVRWHTPAGISDWSYVSSYTPVSSTFTAGAPGDYLVTMEMGLHDPSINSWKSSYQQGKIVVTAPSVAPQAIPPTPNPGGPYTAVEGTPITLDASASYAEGSISSYEWDLNFNGNQFDSDLSGAGSRQSVIFPDNSPSRVIALRVTDNNGLQSIATTTLAVLNANPEPLISSVSGDPREGSVTTLMGSANDPAGIHDTLTYHWRVNKAGDPGVYASGSGSNLNQFSFIPNDDGEYQVSLEVRDEDGGVGVSHALLNVGNVDPEISGWQANGARLEGSTLSVEAYASDPAGIHDPLTFTWSVSKGDSPEAFATAVGQNLNDFSFVPDDNGIYTVRVMVSDGDGGYASFTEEIVISNVAPTVNAGAHIATSENALVVLDSPVFNDKGTFDTHTAVINWGDGTTSEVGLVAESPFGPPGSTAGADGSVAGSHIYADDGIYTVTVTVTDDDGGVGSNSLLVAVKNVNPTLALVPNQTIDEGSLLSIVNIGTFTDPGFDNPLNPNGASVETFTFVVNWGDGTAVNTGSATVDAAGGRGVLTAGSFDDSHIYADNGVYTVTVTVIDDNGGADTESFQVTVNNVNPILAVVTAQTIDEGALLTIVNIGSFTDPGFDNSANPNGASVETFTYVVNWGDGTAVNTGTATVDMNGDRGVLTVGSFDNSHIYADNGVYTVTVTLTDDDGGTDIEAFQVTVNNVNPTLTVVSDQAIDEGAVLSIVNIGTFTDPGFDNPVNPNGASVEAFTYIVNWGDGTAANTGAATVDVKGDRGVLTAGSFDDSHIYADNGIYTVTVTVTDDDGGTDVETFLVTVNNVNPALAVVPNQTIDEGALLSIVNIGTFTDPGFDNSVNPNGASVETFTYIVNWGDGTAANIGVATVDVKGDRGVLTAGSFDGSHIYADNGVYTVTVTVTDDDGGADVETFQVAVTNVNPTLTVVSDQTIDEGALLSIVNIGTFTDPGFDNPANPLGASVETFTYIVNWGDGTAANTGAATVDVRGDRGVLTEGSFDNSHIYADNGIYTVIVTVIDDDGGNDVETFLVTVNNVNPTLAVVPTQSVNEGAVLTVVDIGTITDPGFDNPLNPYGASRETFTYVINWGDGTASDNGDATIDLAGDRGVLTNASFDGSHIFADNGTYTVTITVTDDDGGTDVEQFLVQVSNVAPTVQVAGSSFNIDANNQPIPFSGVRGQILTFDGSFTDPGFDNPVDRPANTNGASVESFTYTVNFGDGAAEVTGVASIDAMGSRGVATRGSLQESHVFTKEGTYIVTTTVIDDDGGTTVVQKSVTIAISSIQADQTDASKRVLAVGGTTSADKIQVAKDEKTNLITVQITTPGLAFYSAVYSAPVARTLVFAQAGHDDLHVNGKLDSIQFGGAGNDKLQGGTGNSVLAGGDGDDFLNGGGSRDILIGGKGEDRLVGSSGEDILISGWTNYDTHTVALTLMQAEWTSTRSNANRITNLSGNGAMTTARLNGSYFLTADSTDGGGIWRGTIHDDRSQDSMTASALANWCVVNFDGETGSIKDKLAGNTSKQFITDLDYLLNP